MSLRVQVAVALPGRQEVIDVTLPPGARVADAVQSARVAERYPQVDWARAAWGVWGRERPLDHPLRDGDRVEWLRPLAADAKDQRRARARLRLSSPRSRSGP